MAEKIAREGYEYRKYIFIHKDGKKITYLLLDKDCINDGRKAIGRMVCYDIKFGNGAPGAVFDIETTLDGKYVAYSKAGILLTEFWKNQTDTTAWRAAQYAFDDKAKLIKQGNQNTLISALQPLKASYSYIDDAQERILFIARIIQFITTGKQ